MSKRSDGPDLHLFADRPAMFDALADALAAELADAAQHAGRASVALAGGSTPAELYPRLATRTLPWDRVTATLSDERWVPAADPASNEAMVARTLLTGAAAMARFIGLYGGGERPRDGLDAVTDRLRAACLPPFDVMLLGMGEDGHTASLFPGGEGLAQALAPADGALVAEVFPASGGPARISLTRPALLQARAIHLCLTGAAKRAVLDAALADGPVEAMPVRAVLHQSAVPVSVWWAP